MLIVRQFKWALSSREVFKWLPDTPAETLTDVQRAARFYYLQHQCFGGKVQGQSWGTDTHAPPVNLLRIEEQLSAAHLRLASTYVERLHWRDCMQRYDQPHTFFHLAPPYWQTEGHDVPFPFSEYQAMAEAMHGLKGKALLSINDHLDIRTCFCSDVHGRYGDRLPGRGRRAGGSQGTGGLVVGLRAEPAGLV